MKKIPAIFFFSLYLFSTTEIHQLLKLPAVFEHFAEHKQEDQHITMLDFLKIHYLNAPIKDKDHDKDMQLPFKTSGDCIAAISPAFVPLLVQLCAAEPIEIFQKKIFFLKDQTVHSAYHANIWQPPKSC